jgi:hypothetical protein
LNFIIIIIINGFPQANSHYYIKIRGDVVHSAACFLGLSQYNLTIQNKNLLDLVFANFSCVNVTISNLYLVEPDAFHPSLVIDLSSTVVVPHAQPSRLSLDYAHADYFLLYSYLSSYDWSYIYNQSSTDSAVNHLKSVVTDALNLAIPNKLSRKSKFPCWFSGTLKNNINKKITIFVVLKRLTLINITSILRIFVN